jgi:sialate O-acetylesterase
MKPACLRLIGLIALLPAVARAEVKPHGLFTDNMVLQRDQKVPVWGTAEEGEAVTVTFGDHRAEAKAKDGKWRVDLPPTAAGGPHVLVIQGKNRREIKNVLVGEVWLCGGQSNMQWSIADSADAAKHIAESANPNLRLFTVPRRGKNEPQTDVEGAWSEAGPQSVSGFSAVAYHFGKKLQAELKIPIGLISSNVGGTAAEEWTAREVLLSHPDLKPRADHARSSKLYNAMIHPLAPFSIRGAIWYQGESNAGRAEQYLTLFPAMIRNWRDLWGQGDFPFLFVQLAPWRKIVEEPAESDWAELREAQRLTCKNVKNTAMAVITDLGDEMDIHPRQKAPVGQRLARAALSLVYGQKIVASGPRFEQLTIDGRKAIVRFSQVGGGLVAKGEKLLGFTLAGEDRKFHNAQAKIEGDTVVVTSDKVSAPLAVRFGWADYPVVNLYNQEGFPASPFRTDDFPGKTTGRR